jgi:UDP-N-acetylmuramoyl-L-alanyl-D-glutamate--2,6-diaminopimelate ligase
MTTQDQLKKMLDAGVEYVIMEVSAHALDMHRLAGIKFEVGSFSNFSQDHLDYFPGMDEYFDCKMKFFDPAMTEQIVYNADDDRIGEAMEKLGRKALRVGIREGSDVYVNDIEISETGSGFFMSWHKHFKIAVAAYAATAFRLCRKNVRRNENVNGKFTKKILKNYIQN